MSEYIYNTVTSYGAALIAQATAANPIVIVGALSKATAASGAQELATAPASWYDGRAGAIATVSATGNVARIVAVFRNAGESRQAAKSIAVTARLASQPDGEAVVLVAISDPASTIELPSEADTGQAVEFPINIAINPGGTITVTPGASASVADLDRFVSTHSPGQPTTGEAQTIYGEKTFVNTLQVSAIGTNSITSTSGTFVYGIYPAEALSADIGNATFPFNNAAILNIKPHSNNAGSVGSSDYRYEYVYSKYIGSIDHPSNTIYGDNIGYTKYVNGSTVGTEFKGIKAIVNNISTDSITCTGDIGCSGTITANSVVPSDQLLGTSLGSSGLYYDHVYAANLHGVIPVPTDETTIPVGAIVVLRYTPASLSGTILTPGQLFDCSTSQYQGKFVQCSLSGTEVSSAPEYLLGDGKFIAISYLPGGEHVLLAIKIAD